MAMIGYRFSLSIKAKAKVIEGFFKELFSLAT